MPTSSITHNFVISGEDKVEKFINAIEESYQESLNRPPTKNMRITYLIDTEEIKRYMERRNRHA